MPDESPIADLKLHCPKCDYNLTGLTDSKCPECGATFDLAELGKAPRPPWFLVGAWGRVFFLLAPGLALLAIGEKLVMRKLSVPYELAMLPVLCTWLLSVVVAFVGPGIRARWYRGKLVQLSPSGPPVPASLTIAIAYGILMLLIQLFLVISVFVVAAWAFLFS